MRIALFSDIHGNITGLRAVIAQLDQLGGVDVVFCAGDFVGGGAGTDEIFDLLIEKKTRMVRGNHDELFLNAEIYKQGRSSNWIEQMEWAYDHLSKPYHDLIQSLPLTEELEVAPNRKLFVCHAAPTDPWAWVCAADTPTQSLQSTFGKIDAEVIARGHFHEHHVLWLDAKLLLNVASVGLRSDGLSAFTLLEFLDGRWNVHQQLVPYDVKEEERLNKIHGVPALQPLDNVN